MKDALCAVANTWNTMTKDIVVHAWPMTVFSDDDEQSNDFEEFYLYVK